MRLIGIAFLILVALGSIYGFIAALEPTAEGTPHRQWQAIYGGVLLLCLIGIIILVRQARRAKR